MKVDRSVDLNFASKEFHIKQQTVEKKDLPAPNSFNVDNISDQEKNLLPVSEKAIIKAIEKANKIMIGHSTRAEFSVHEVTKDIMIKIVDTESNKVIREFPPEKILDMVAKIWELSGLFVDERR
jgi:flagellar protein FlaG